MQKPKKVVLAYSGGLDTSVILKWLQDHYHCEIVTFTADLGQGEELEPARAKAIKFGIKPENIFIDDVREEFVRDFVFPMFRANTVYEGEYLLGTSIARPLIAKRLIEVARETNADAISHGATGKGNDQVRFELGAYALNPNIHIIAPWREWDLLSREKLLAYAEQHGIPVGSPEELIQHKDVIRKLEEEVMSTMGSVAKYEQVKKFVLLPRLFTVQDGEITPTLKLKRKAIYAKHEKAILALYE